MTAASQTRAFRGIWIKAEIWVSDLTPFEKILLAEIDSLATTEKGCFASNEYFANFLGLSESRIAHILGDLKKKGLVYQSYFDGRTRGLKTDVTKLPCYIQQSMSDTTNEPCQIQQGTLAIPDITPIYNKDYNKSNSIEGESKATQQASVTPLPSSSKRFIKPSLEELEKEFNKLLGGNGTTEAKKFFDHYETVGWVVGKNKTPMKSWISAVSQWCSRTQEWNKQKPKVTASADTFDAKSFMSLIP